MSQLRVLWKEPDEPIRQLDQMSLLETGVEKKVLIPKLQDHIERDINSESK